MRWTRCLSLLEVMVAVWLARSWRTIVARAYKDAYSILSHACNSGVHMRRHCTLLKTETRTCAPGSTVTSITLL